MADTAPDRIAPGHPLLVELWSLVLDGPETALERIAARARAPDDAAVLDDWIDVIAAHAHHSLGHDAPRDAPLERAERGFTAVRDSAGLAACTSLRAACLSRAGRYQEAIEALDRNDSVPLAERSAFEHYFSIGRRRHAHWYLEHYDDALRDSLRLVEAARDLVHRRAESNALALLGGLEADLFNLDDAQRHCTQALELAAGGDDAGILRLARRNLAYVFDALGQHAQARSLVESLLPDQEGDRGAENRWLIYATVLLHAGEAERAQALLDQSVALREGDSADLNAWTATQAEAHLANAAPKARSLCETYLANIGHDPSRSPSDTMRIYRAASKACAALGDHRAALVHQQAAFACYETLVGRAANARRIALEVEHHLERERWERERAQQRQHEAEAEGERLDQLNRALEAANQAKTRFLAAASHDLRQPVQALTMYTAALGLEPTSEKQRDLIARVDDSVAALARMFDGLLDVSRLDAGVIGPRLRSIVLAPLLQRLADDCRAVAAAQGLEVRLRLPRARDAGTLLTRSDALLLERCLRNLLDNARKYTRSGGVVLALRQRDIEPAPIWRIEVRDTGVGIAPGDQARVFDEFFQVDAESPHAGEARGLGLGLAIVYRIARLLEHPLGLRSRPGRGTCVWLDLPQVQPIANAPPAAPAFAARDPQPLRLALIEDDDAVRAAIEVLLTRWQHRVFSGADAASVLAAWRAAARPLLHGVITDLRLRAGADGFAAVHALRAELGSDLPVLVLTGESAPEPLNRLRDSRWTWLPKPVQPVRLRSWLQSVAASLAGA